MEFLIIGLVIFLVGYGAGYRRGSGRVAHAAQTLAAALRGPR